jgi:DNA-binding response OmpR family regulator
MMNSANPLQGKRILVIEDEYLVAQVVIDYLEDAGAEVVGPFGRIDDALAFIDNHHFTLDAAVLDVNLHGQKSYPIADALAANNVMFVFATGYGGETLDSRYLHFRRCEKPFNQQALIAALCKSCATF